MTCDACPIEWVPKPYTGRGTDADAGALAPVGHPAHHDQAVGTRMNATELRVGDALALIQDIPDGSVDVIVTSPPYDEIRDYQGNWTLDLPALGPEVHRVLRDGGVACVVIGDGTVDGAKTGTTSLLTASWITDTPLRLFESLVYQRHGRPGPWWASRFRVDHETILVFLKGSRRAYLDKTHLREPAKSAGRSITTGTMRTESGGFRKPNGERTVGATKERGTVWRYHPSTSEQNRLKTQHPATFPDQLASDLIRAFAPEGGLVLDPFVGSGTVLVEAAKAGRRAIGFDISPEYAEIARQRLELEVSA